MRNRILAVTARLREAVALALAITAAMLLFASADSARAASVDIASPAPGETLASSNATLSFSVSGINGFPWEIGTRCMVDGSRMVGGRYLSCTPGSGEFMKLANGPHRIDIYAWDGPDNVAVTSRTFVVDDTTDPTVTITPSPNSTTITGPVGFAIQMSGTTTASCRVDDQPPVDCSGIASNADPTTGGFRPKSWSAGDHTVYATATDPAGNTTTASLAVTVADVTAPTVTINSPAESATLDQSPLFVEIELEEVGALIECSVDGAAYFECVDDDYECTWFMTITCSIMLGLTNGEHAVSVRATDAAGNVSGVQSRSFTVADTTAPSVAFSSPSDGAGIDGSAGEYVDTEFSSPDPGKYDCATDGGAWEPCFHSDEWSSATSMMGWPGMGYPDSNGGHEFAVRVTDPMGRAGTDSVSFTIDDHNPPDGYIAWPPAGAEVSSPFVVIPGGPYSFDPSRCEYRLDSESFTTCDASPGLDAVTAAPGPHTISIRFKDWVGNTTVVSRQVVVAGAVAPPAAPPVAPPPAAPTPRVRATKPKPRRKGRNVSIPMRFSFSLEDGDLATACRGKSALRILHGKRRLASRAATLKLRGSRCEARAAVSLRHRSVRGKRLRITASVGPGNSGFAEATGSTTVKIRR